MTDTAHTGVVSWTVDDVVYEVDLLAIDGLEWREAKRAVGRILTEKDIALLAIDGDMECVAALIWVVRRRTDPEVEYEDVLAPMRLVSFLPPGWNSTDEKDDDGGA